MNLSREVEEAFWHTAFLRLMEASKKVTQAYCSLNYKRMMHINVPMDDVKFDEALQGLCKLTKPTDYKND